eukprot:scaffold3801_cov124-Isochrysis_galbana.AAC.16
MGLWVHCGAARPWRRRHLSGVYMETHSRVVGWGGVARASRRRRPWAPPHPFGDTLRCAGLDGLTGGMHRGCLAHATEAFDDRFPHPLIGRKRCDAASFGWKIEPRLEKQPTVSRFDGPCQAVPIGNGANARLSCTCTGAARRKGLSAGPADALGLGHPICALETLGLAEVTASCCPSHCSDARLSRTSTAGAVAGRASLTDASLPPSGVRLFREVAVWPS